jgi:hypothetical protein
LGKGTVVLLRLPVNGWPAKEGDIAMLQQALESQELNAPSLSTARQSVTVRG